MEYELGVSKITKNILGTDYDFTYVGDKDDQTVFMCDTNVESYVFNEDKDKSDANKYEGSDLEARVATYDSEYFIPTVEDIANWTDTDISTLDIFGYVLLNSNSPMYDFVIATEYWTSSAYPSVGTTAYFVFGGNRIGNTLVKDTYGVRPCFTVANTQEPQEEIKPITGLKFKNDDNVYAFVDTQAREDIEEIQGELDEKINAQEVYTKSEINTLLYSKEDKSKVTINNTSYEIRIDTSGADGYLTIELED